MSVRLFCLALLGYLVAVGSLLLEAVRSPIAYFGICIFFGAVGLALVYGLIFGEAP